MLTIYDDSINDYNLPLDENHYNPDDYLPYLKNEHYHHSEKGCVVEMTLNKTKEGDRSVNKICHTHGQVCSKTGWEVGWYMGTKTKELLSKTFCRRCHKLLFVEKTQRSLLCPECKVERLKERKEQNTNRMRIAREQYESSKRFVAQRSQDASC